MKHWPEIKAIVRQIESWPIEDKRELVKRLLEQRPSDESAVNRPSLGELLGIGNPTGRHLTDVEVDELRYQALKEKLKL
jgi:hypothetical protein